jgi:predicted MPP superfamily phosphohydrolase
MQRFLTFLIFLGISYAYIGSLLVTSSLGWAILLIPFILVLSFPFRRLGEWHVQLIYMCMAILSNLFVFSTLALLINSFSPYFINHWWIYGLSLLAILLGSFNARKPKVKEVIVPFDHLPSELENFTILQISDLHVGANIGKEYVLDVVTRANALEPDLIVLTGDIGDGPPERHWEDMKPMGSLRAQHGVFYVPGNHETYWNLNGWMTVMNNLKFVILVNRGKMISHKGINLYIGGVSDPTAMAPDPTSVYEGGKEAPFKILLSHRPGIAKVASVLGFNLTLAGHTHGGQFFPWTYVVKLVHQFSKGLHRVNEMQLYVSQGTGSWGPLIRLGSDPEITFLTLKTQENQTFIR